jgi:hypothetical protein
MSPGLFYNYTEDGKPVAYKKYSRLNEIRMALHSAYGVEVTNLVAERQAILEGIVNKSGESHP